MRKKINITIHCYNCTEVQVTKNEIGLTKKLIDINSDVFYCISCLAEQLEVDVDFLRDRILEFKEQGCDLFT